MKHYDALIVGAGPAGMACAYQLGKSGSKDVLLLEANNEVGGLSRSIDFMGSRVDIGPHRFLTQHKAVFQLYQEVLGEDLLAIERNTCIHFQDQFIKYPLEANDLLKRLGFGSGLRIFTSYLLSRFKTYGDHFEGALKKRFGEYLFNLFFKEYSEKLWGLPVNEIDASWAQQRIQNFSLSESVKALINKSSEKTVSPQFFYPRFGSGHFYQKLKQMLLNQGVEIQLNCKITKIELQPSGKGYIVTDAQGNHYSAKHLVSTMPLNHLLKALPYGTNSLMKKVGQLKFRSTIFVYVQLDQPEVNQDQWTYLQMPEVGAGRMTNFNNWSPDQIKDPGKSHLCLEYWANEGDALFEQTEDAFKQMATDDFQRIGLLENAEILAFKVLKVRKTYPVYYRNYQNDVAEIRRYLNCFERLYPIGRYGSYKYNNQDHSLLMGLQAAEKIIGMPINLWNIEHNTYLEKGNVDEAVS